MTGNCHVPVSYTHLDVYKRQDIGDTSVLVNKPADSIKEAIEKYKDVAGQFV